MEEGIFIIVHDWVIQRLKISEAMCYELIRSFCKDGSKYSGGSKYIAQRLGITENAVSCILSKLRAMNVLEHEYITNGRGRYSAYWPNDENLAKASPKNLGTPTQETCIPITKKLGDPSPKNLGTPTQETCDNNKYNNKDYKENNKDNKESNDSSIATAKRKAGIDYEEFKNFFNMTMNEAGAMIPRITDMTPKRKGMINARVKKYGLETVREVVRKSAASTYMNGGGRGGWFATFDWIFRPNNFVKILENNYNDNNPNNNGRDNIRRGAWPTPAENATRAEEWATKRILELTQQEDKGIQGEIPDDRETDQLFLPF